MLIRIPKLRLSRHFFRISLLPSLKLLLSALTFRSILSDGIRRWGLEAMKLGLVVGGGSRWGQVPSTGVHCHARTASRLQPRALSCS